MECIYMIRNMVNGRVYIGATRNFNRRIIQHRHRLNHNLMAKSLLQQDWNEHGSSMFAFSVLCETTGMTPSKIAELEMQYIDDAGGLDSDCNYNLLTPVAFEQRRISKLRYASIANNNSTDHRSNQTCRSKSRKQVYIIRNIMTGRVFIDFSGVAGRRLIEHKFKLQSGCHEIEDLQRDWNAYGPESFSFEILLDRTEADFNVMKLTISDNLLYRYPEKRKGRRPMSTETKEKIRKSMTGHTISDETKAKISKSMKDRWGNVISS